MRARSREYNRNFETLISHDNIIEYQTACSTSRTVREAGQLLSIEKANGLKLVSFKAKCSSVLFCSLLHCSIEAPRWTRGRTTCTATCISVVPQAICCKCAWVMMFKYAKLRDAS